MSLHVAKEEQKNRNNGLSPIGDGLNASPVAFSYLDVGAVGKEAGRLTVSLVIPALNEARNLPHVLERLPDCLTEVILVDGRSSDITCAAARSCRPDIRIITEPHSGKGHALRAGFSAATGDIIVAMDADGSMSPEEIPHFVYFLEHGFDFVKGSRFVAGGGSLDITTFRRAGNKALLALANVLYRSHFTDLCYGYFAFRRQYLDHLDLRASGFEIETEVTISAFMAGLRFAEVPSLELPRRSGRSNLHAISDGQRVAHTLVSYRRRVSRAPVAGLGQREQAGLGARLEPTSEGGPALGAGAATPCDGRDQTAGIPR